MNFTGLAAACAAFLIIGLFHPIVIKCEYYFSAKIWPVFFISGIIFLILSVLNSNILISVVLGIIGCACLWSILELKEQEKRVQKGWFPSNPKRKNKQKI